MTAMIFCYGAGRLVGRIDFYAEGVALPLDLLTGPDLDLTSERLMVILSMPMTRFEAVMSTLRNEKPLVLYIDVDRVGQSATRGEGCLGTSLKEPVGEEEAGP